MRYMRWLLCFAVGLAVVSAVRPASALTVSVVVSPNPYSGPCPQDAKQMGVLQLTGAVTGATPNGFALVQFVVLSGSRPIWNTSPQKVTLDGTGSATAKGAFTPPASGYYKAEINVSPEGAPTSISHTTDFSATCAAALSLDAARVGSVAVRQPNAAFALPSKSVKGLIILEGQSEDSVDVFSTQPVAPRSASQVSPNAKRLDDCTLYFVSVKMGDGSVHTVPTQAAGKDHCSYVISGSWLKAPYDVLVGLGGPKRGWQLGKHSISVDTMDQERIDFTFRKIDIENKIGKSQFQDDWNSTP